MSAALLASALDTECWAQKEAQQAAWYPQPWSLLADGNQFAILSVGGTMERHDCYWRVLRMQTLATPGTSRFVKVARSHCSVGGYPSYASGKHLTDGRWALVGDFHGGGDRMLQGTVVALDLSGGPVDVDDRVPARFRHVLLPDGRKAYDLFKPTAFEREGVLWVGGSAGALGGMPGRNSWVAEYSPQVDFLTARLAMKGIDLRVVSGEDRPTYFTRDVGLSFEMGSIAPVLVYTEGESSTPVDCPSPPKEWKVSTYDAFGSDGTLWVLGVTGDSDEGRWSGELMRLDTGKTAWELEGFADFREFPTCVYLRPGANEGRPDLVCLERGLLVKKPWVLASEEDCEWK